MSRRLNRGDTIQVVQSKFNHPVYRSIPKRILGWLDDAFVLEGAPGQRVDAQTGNWTTSHHDIAFNWFDKWFSVIEYYTPAGAFDFFYVNVQEPARWEGDTLQVVDLDLDLWVKPDLTWELLDVDEFQAHCLEYSYPPGLVAQVNSTITELQRRIERQDFPFRRGVKTFFEEREKLLELMGHEEFTLPGSRPGNLF